MVRDTAQHKNMITNTTQQWWFDQNTILPMLNKLEKFWYAIFTFQGVTSPLISCIRTKTLSKKMSQILKYK